MVAIGILSGLCVLAALWAVGVYNALVGLRENVRNGWSQIDVQLKRRHDLIPNLVETAKGYLGHERNTLEKVIQARRQAVDARGLQDKQQAENFLTGALRSLFAVTEQYPNLKADHNMRRLHEELLSTENKITFARQYYNDEVNRLNTRIQSFPDGIIADRFHFQKAEFFQIDDASERAVPQVKF